MYTFERFNFRIFPFFLLFLGVTFTVSEMYIHALILGMPGGLLAISFKGININPQTNEYRKFDRFLWFYIGKWEKFKRPLYVTVVRYKVSNKRIAPSPIIAQGGGGSYSNYKINLVVDGKRRYITLLKGKRFKMLEEGLKIAQALNIKLLDHTTPEKRWLT